MLHPDGTKRFIGDDGGWIYSLNRDGDGESTWRGELNLQPSYGVRHFLCFYAVGFDTKVQVLDFVHERFGDYTCVSELSQSKGVWERAKEALNAVLRPLGLEKSWCMISQSPLRELSVSLSL